MKKLLIILVILLAVSGHIFAQENCLNLIEEGNYAKAEKKITAGLAKKPNDIILNFALSSLLIQRDYKGYDAKSAYECIMRTQSLFPGVSDQGEIRDLEKIPINPAIMQNMMDKICRSALEDASAVNSIKEYEAFLDYYSTAPGFLKEEAKTKRNILAYKAACDANTVDSYQSFISTYPFSIQQPEAKTRRNSLAFAKAKATNTIQAYKEFMSQYRDATEVKEAMTKVHELAFAQAEKENTSRAYKKFIDEYPTSLQYPKAFNLFEQHLYSENTSPGNWKSYYRFIEDYPANKWAGAALDTLFEYGSAMDDLIVLRFCVKHMTGPERNKALLYYHKVFTNDGEKPTLDLFYNEFDDYILQGVKERDYELATLGDELDLFDAYNPADKSKYEDYILQAAPLEKAFVALQRMIANDIKNKNWESAANTVKSYSVYFGPGNKKIRDLISVLEGKYDNSIKINSVGSNVNTKNGGEYAPVPSADGKYLYFCGRFRNDNKGGEDIFVSKLSQGAWGKAAIIDDLSYTFSNDAPLSVSTDGNTMLLFQSGDLYYSEKSSLGWLNEAAFPELINSGEWQADAMYSSDGNALIFTSVREGGFNTNSGEESYHGSNAYASDIYVSVLNEYNQWGSPINLGPVINTRYCDRSPFLHPDMKTLYFASDGHGGLGKFDVFKSTRLADTCWDCWSEPVNMGKEINTSESDWGYRITTDGDKAYFAKKVSTDDYDDIYWLNLPNRLRPDFVATISGQIRDSENNPLSAEIKWEDLETGEKVGQSKSNPSDGSYFIVLPLGKMYGYYVNKPGYYPLSNNVDLRNYEQAKEIVEDITLISYEQMEQGITVRINNLFFNFDESTILPYSIPELRRLAGIIKSNNHKVEISGHTDSIGDDQYNQDLSEKRAAAVKDFLVNEGCDADRLVTIGYGRSRPVASNEDDEGRAKNRRVEIKFIG